MLQPTMFVSHTSMICCRDNWTAMCMLCCPLNWLYSCNLRNHMGLLHPGSSLFWEDMSRPSDFSSTSWESTVSGDHHTWWIISPNRLNHVVMINRIYCICITNTVEQRFHLVDEHDVPMPFCVHITERDLLCKIRKQESVGLPSLPQTSFICLCFNLSYDAYPITRSKQLQVGISSWKLVCLRAQKTAAL